VETGARSPNIETLERMASGLDVEMTDFFEGYEIPKAERPLSFGMVEERGHEEVPIEHISQRIEDPELRRRLLNGPRSELDHALTQLVEENKVLREELLKRQ
jgi:transcriptional regulator with XRE-family HTH domain